MKKVKAIERSEGRGASVKRAFPSAKVNHLDPFVLLDEFFVESPAGFPEHPHKGFEAVTYLLEGRFRHTDSTGAEELLSPGDVQVVTTGKGMRHSEMPGNDQNAHGFQLWVNLPQALKDIEPSYTIYRGNQLPVEKNGMVRTKVVGPDSPVKLKIDITYDFIKLDNASFLWKVQKEWNGFIYLSEGSCQIGEWTVSAGELLVKNFRGELHTNVAAKNNASLIAVTGHPLKEPIKQRGPFVE